jgi:hypothetical protein
MIFFKSVTDIKKRSQDQKDRIKPVNIKNAKSRVSTNIKKKQPKDTRNNTHYFDQ